MALAEGRLTELPGVAMVTRGPGRRQRLHRHPHRAPGRHSHDPVRGPDPGGGPRPRILPGIRHQRLVRQHRQESGDARRRRLRRPRGGRRDLHGPQRPAGPGGHRAARGRPGPRHRRRHRGTPGTLPGRTGRRGPRRPGAAPGSSTQAADRGGRRRLGPRNLGGAWPAGLPATACPSLADFRAYDAVPHRSDAYAGYLGYARSDANARRLDEADLLVFVGCVRGRRPLRRLQARPGSRHRRGQRWTPTCWATSAGLDQHIPLTSPPSPGRSPPRLPPSSPPPAGCRRPRRLRKVLLRRSRTVERAWTSASSWKSSSRKWTTTPSSPSGPETTRCGRPAT